MTMTSVRPEGQLRALLWSPSTMIIVALALRLVVMGFVYPRHLRPARDHWAFGWETGRVARSIATGQGFSSPYDEPTGPTALESPVYPTLLAGIFKLFGVYTAASALVILTLNNLFSALTCLPVFLIARRVFGLQTAVWAGWIWVLFPYSLDVPNEYIWETCLTTLLLSLLLLATLRLERSASYIAWTGYGLLWALAALTSAATLSTLPFLGGWIWLRHSRRGNSCTGAAIVASVVFLAAVAPWIWRCSQMYGRFIPFRSNFAMEVVVGNNDDTSKLSNPNVMPADSRTELEKLRRIGELAYIAEMQSEARGFVMRHPLRAVVLTFRRILNTWTGVWTLHPTWGMDETDFPNIFTYTAISLLAFAGVGRAIRDGQEFAVPLMILLIVFPMVYYVTHTDVRYRLPIDPVVVIFMAYRVICFRSQEATLPREERLARPLADSFAD
jgi:hypothetical protein